MKYVYINEAEDRIVLTANKVDDELRADNVHTEYAVSDEFDFGKDMPGPDGETVRLEGFLTPAEFLERRNADYVSRRLAEYPTVGDQLDALFKAGAFPEDMAAAIQAVKDNNPKSA